MNPDETKSVITKVLLVLLTSLSTSMHLSESAGTLATAASDIADLAVLFYGIYSHRGMKKVPETAKVIGGLVLLGLLLALPTSGRAADMKPVTFKAPFLSVPACTQQLCTSWFVGANTVNGGGNFDVLGSGLQGLASNGVSLGGQLGAEFWNGQWYASARAIGDYQITLNGVGHGASKELSGGGIVSLGYSLASAFGAGATGQAAPTLPGPLAASLMTPYINAGFWHHKTGGLVTGVGVEALLATNWTLNADYLHVNYNTGDPTVIDPIIRTENLFLFSINRHFAF